MTTSPPDPRDLPVVVDALRTPIGTAGHGLRDVDAADLAAPVLAALAARALAVDEVVLGNCMGPGGDVARVAALSAGLPLAVPALTVDRQCGSGLAAVTVGAGAGPRRCLGGGRRRRRVGLDRPVAVLAPVVAGR